jgi:hypothetical protein
MFPEYRLKWLLLEKKHHTHQIQSIMNTRFLKLLQSFISSGIHHKRSIGHNLFKLKFIIYMSKDIFKFTTPQYHHHPYHIQDIECNSSSMLSLPLLFPECNGIKQLISCHQWIYFFGRQYENTLYYILFYFLNFHLQYPFNDGFNFLFSYFTICRLICNNLIKLCWVCQ